MPRGRHLVRIKAKPLDPAVAQKYWLDWDAKALRRDAGMFPPLTSPALFGNRRPLEVEIGSGSGEYLVALASHNPETNFLGIEVSFRSATFAATLASKAELDNLRILRANFKLLYPNLQADSWARVYLHFPDPVHRREDRKRNLFTAEFLDAMASTLLPGGELSVASDKPEFFLAMLDLAEEDNRFEKVHAERYLEGLETPVKSRFQRFWERKGIGPLRFVLRRRSPNA